MPKANTTIAGHKAAEMRTSGNWCAPMRATETITIIIPRATPGSWHPMDACLRAPSLPQQPAALLHPARVAGACRADLQPVRRSGDLAGRHLRHLGAAGPARRWRPGTRRPELGQRRRRQQELRDLRHGRGAVRPGPRLAAGVPEVILFRPVTRETLDFTRPVALILAAIMHFLMPDESRHGSLSPWWTPRPRAATPSPRMAQSNPSPMSHRYAALTHDEFVHDVAPGSARRSHCSPPGLA